MHMRISVPFDLFTHGQQLEPTALLQGSKKMVSFLFWGYLSQNRKAQRAETARDGSGLET